MEKCTWNLDLGRWQSGRGGFSSALARRVESHDEIYK